MASTPGTEPGLMSDGFRERGAQVTRLEAFVDAAFAFSLTMLVISTNDVPRSIPASGPADSVVPFRQSETMARMLKQAGKQVTLVKLDGEDHWLSRSATRQRVLEEMETFLALHLQPTG